MEPSLSEAPNLVVSGTDTTFAILVDTRATNGGGTFSMALDGAGNVTRSCTNPGAGGGRAAADSSGNRW